jgi:hypothetical protein
MARALALMGVSDGFVDWAAEEAAASTRDESKSMRRRVIGFVRTRLYRRIVAKETSSAERNQPLLNADLQRLAGVDHGLG